MVYFNAENLNLIEKVMSLESAPKHIKLAVDLIEILEENEVDNKTAVDALKIVLDDYISKLKDENKP